MTKHSTEFRQEVLAYGAEHGIAATTTKYKISNGTYYAWKAATKSGVKKVTATSSGNGAPKVIRHSKSKSTLNTTGSSQACTNDIDTTLRSYGLTSSSIIDALPKMVHQIEFLKSVVRELLV